MKDLVYMIRRLFRQRTATIVAILLTAGQCALKLWLPRMMEDTVNRGVLAGSLDYVRVNGLQMLGVCVVLGICGYVTNLLCAVISQRFALQLRIETYQNVTGLSTHQVTQLGCGTLITSLTSDIDQCASLIGAIILLVVEPLLLMVGGVGMMWRIAPTFGLMFIGFVAVQLIAMVLFIRRTAPGFSRVRDAMDAMNSRLQLALSNFSLAKMSNTQTVELTGFDRKNEAFFDAAYSVQKLVAIFSPVIMLLMNMAVACVLWMSGHRMSTGTINVGMVLSAITYSEQVLLSVMTGGLMYRKITEAQPSARRVRRILSIRPDMADGEAHLGSPFRDLSFQEVKFAYADDDNVLDGVNYTIIAGEFLAVIGSIGSGKTTLADLSARLFDATDGQVILNGRPIAEWRMADVLKAVALVEKQSDVLEGTVEENVRFGREGIERDEVLRALDVAQMKDYIEDKPAGLETQLASLGKSMSGGERQRLTIARALAGRPGLLILDDATSALDYETERMLFNAVRRNYPNMAVLLITNRLFSAMQADRILVLNEGRVEAEGTDEVLRNESPLYRRICAVQDIRMT